jgi:hypothetical protein
MKLPEKPSQAMYRSGDEREVSAVYVRQDGTAGIVMRQQPQPNYSQLSGGMANTADK